MVLRGSPQWILPSAVNQALQVLSLGPDIHCEDRPLCSAVAHDIQGAGGAGGQVVGGAAGF